MNAIVENAIGGLIASEAHGVIGIVLSRINAEIKLAWGFKKELEELQGQLTRLIGLLQGTYSQAITNQVMDDWLKKIKDAAYDADNLLDEWSYEALEARIRIRKRDKFIRGVSKPFYSLRMGHKARDMTKLISNIYSDANKLGIKPIHVAAGEVYNRKHSHQIEDQETRLCNMRHYVDEKLLIGRDEDLAHLVKLLCDSNNYLSNLTVIGIVGMAGLGKTILCKRISKVHEVTKFFNSMVIWLVISSSFDLLDVLNRMVEIVLKESSNMRDRQALISRLHGKLKKKRYLLILDDVWNPIDWDSLKSTLEEIGGSRGTTLVLVTSRDKLAVEKMETTCYDSEGKITIKKKPSIYMLQGLSERDSWSLLMKSLGDDNLVGSEKELIARRMMKNCGGVPLAIKALGNLLRDKDIEIWKEFEKSHLWTNKDKNGILPSLRLSYDYLPCTALKKCFAYCAIFEEDDIIEKQKLICMWMAQGFLHPYDEMEAKGEEYIEHLLNSSLFQEPKMDEFGKVKTFKMHDLVLSLARVISDEDETSNEVRHLIVPKHSKSKELTLTSSTKRLRTCLLYNKKLEGPSLHVLLKNNHLRVLDIGQNWSEDFDWELLGRLRHLRYFGSSASYGLGFIAKLYHLQTLCMYSHNQLVTDPNKSIFPKEIGNLVNLRHILYVNDIGVPLGLGNLTALQTLPSINFGKKWGGTFSELGSLKNLRGTLKLYNLNNLSGKEEARSLLLDNKSYLSSLVFNWVHNLKIKKETNDNEILETLQGLQPNANLKMFEILNYCGTRFPKWLIEGGSSLPNLVSLKIYRCEAKENLKLENLRYLRFLTIHYCKKLIIELPEEGFRCCKSLEEIMVVDGGYYFRNPVGLGSLPCLRELCTDVIQLVTDMGEDSPVCKSLEKLQLIGNKTDDNCFGNELPDQLQHLRALQCLAIEDFPNLKRIPDWLGKLTSLRELSLLSLPSLKYLPFGKYLPNEMSSCWVRHGETWSRNPDGFYDKSGRYIDES